MIPLALYLVFLWFALLCSGAVAIRFFHFASIGTFAVTGWSVRHEDRLFFGLIAVVSLGEAVSLFSPLNLFVVAALAILLIGLGGFDTIQFLKSGRDRTSGEKFYTLIFAATCWLLAMAYVATEPTKHFDTGLYHAQMVKWNKDFGVVPGLANLHARLGFNSAWDLFGALVDHGYFSARSFHVVSLVIGAMFLLVCLRGYYQWWQGSRSVSTVLRALGLIILIYHFRSVLSSISNDWPSALLVCYAAILAAECAEQRTLRQPGQQEKTSPTVVLLAASCFFAVTVKLSIVPILLLLLVPFIFGANRLQYLRVVLVTASLTIVPFVGRNIVLSGYVVYPSTALDLFNPSWKVPPADVEFQTKLLKSWAMMPSLDWYRASDMSWGEWLRTWYRLRHDAIVGTIPWLLLGFGTWIWANIRQWRHASEGWAYNLICLFLLGGILFCFFTAPDPRFAMPWIMTFSLIAMAWLIDSIVRQTQWSNETCRLGAQIALLVTTCWFVGHAGPKRFFHDPVATLCRLNDLPKAELQEVTSNYGVRVNLALNTKQAWNAALPNTPDFNRWLQLRGKTLAEGFVVTKPFAAEWRPGL